MATLTYSPPSFRPMQRQSDSGSLSKTSISSSQSPSTYANSSASFQTVTTRTTNNSSALSPQNQRAPVTPPTATAATSVPRRDSPGSWKHPRAQEIAQRQRASTFGPDNAATIIKCVIVLLGTEILRWVLVEFVWKLISPFYQLTGNTPLWLVRSFALYFLIFAVKPLWSGPDQLLDVDLNATQRSLLGLDPNATPPATPATKYVTPPRYARSITPRSGTPGSRGSSPANSPLAHKDSSGYRRASGSFLPANSTSLQASYGADSRRNSFSISGLGTPSKDGSVFAPQTPSPIGKASGIVFSNKWLYHKGIRSGSMSRDLFKSTNDSI